MTLQRAKRVRDFWHLLQKMQTLINAGATPNAAAVKVATAHWRDTPAKSYDAMVAWLKDNARRYQGELRPRTLRERIMEGNARLDRENPNWREEARERELAHLDAMMEGERQYNKEHPEELAQKSATNRKDSCRRELEALIERDPEMVLAKLLGLEDE